MTVPVSDVTLGIEEEYQIVHPLTRALRPRAERVLPLARQTLGDQAQPELYRAQIEMVTPVCHTLAEARAALVRGRRAILEAAAQDGHRIAAAGTHPFSRPEDQQITPKERYEDIATTYQALARDHVICGCHVHVGVADPTVALAVLNRVRPWLAPLLALSASSPFWQGADTGYASYRSELWGRWPLAGPPGFFASPAEYAALVHALVATGSIDDESKLYWDVRLPVKTPTVEVRVADVCTTVDEAVLIAGLTRALAQTCAAEAQRDAAFPATRPELLRAAHWRAARYGLEGELIDVAAERAVPAHDLVRTLLAFVRPALEEQGDWDEIAALTQQTLRGGTSAARQRAAYRRAGRWDDVVDLVVADTARGVIAV